MRSSLQLRSLRQYISSILCTSLFLLSWVGIVSFAESATAAPAPEKKEFQDGVDDYMRTANVVSTDADKQTLDVTYLFRKDDGDLKRNWTFFQIDISSIPQNADVIDAELVLTTLPFGNNGAASVTVAVYKVIQDWPETVTWNTAVETPIFDPNSVWTQPIGCTGNGATCHIDLTDLAQQWVSEPTENNGFMLTVAEEIPSGSYFAMTFFSDTVGSTPNPKRPNLTVNYTIPPTSVDVTPATLSLMLGGVTEQLTATVLPVTATNQNVTWSSSDANVATVDLAGVVTPVGRGTATITATTEDGGLTDTSEVKVYGPADLDELTLSQGSLTPAFDVETTSYSAGVESNVDSVKLTPTVFDPGATIKLNDQLVANGAESQAILLKAGENEITIVVTSQDGSTTRTYTVTVTRAPSNSADLSNLTLSKGTLNPVFASGVTGYSVTVSNSVYAMTVTPTATDPNATIQVNGEPVSSSAASREIPLKAGENQIDVTVTAEDGVTTKTYAIKVTREQSPPSSSDSNTGGNAKPATPAPAPSPGTGNKPDDKPGDKPSEPPVDAGCTKLAWTDVQNHWARTEIEAASQLCLVKGVSNEKFLPDDELTRLQFALMVARAMKLEQKENAAGLDAFKDVKDIPGWAAAELSAAIQAGVIVGYDDNTLRPNRKINRAEMVTMLIRGWGIAASQATSSFADEADIPKWAKGYVARAAEIGIIAGRTDNHFDPSGSATRAEAAVVLVNMLKDRP